MTATEPVPRVRDADPRLRRRRAQSLGEHQVGEQVSFQVPEGTWSFTIVSQEVAGSAADTI